MSNTNTRGVYSMLRLVHFSRTLSVNEQTRKKSDTCEILRRKGEGGRAVPQMKRERKEIKPRALRPKMAAQYLGMSISAFYEARKTQSDFPRGRKLTGKLTVFLPEDLDEYLTSRPEA